MAAFARDRGVQGLTLDGEVEPLSIGAARSLLAGTADGPRLAGDGQGPRS